MYLGCVCPSDDDDVSYSDKFLNLLIVTTLDGLLG